MARARILPAVRLHQSARRLVRVGAVRDFGRGQTLGNSFEVKAAPLDGSFALAGVVLERPMVEFQPVFPMANIGARVLGELAVTFDQKNNQMRVTKPARYPDQGHDLKQPRHIQVRDTDDAAWMRRFVAP